ncbi:hypothetical protein T4B_10252 [Trichinella pseudospiralis]|uniref:Uncharacterized protein n=1 Tax=Trichinella pseudospiralis TaxID=6337 RepID=A0A0V1JI56_TRIPS|nr:hypothetical protein T4A_502 [Trichinella pseudospiralis]KRZ34573.1 hypothetical protein T4B_10252 [Trichinella pseudospiralis]
MYNDAVKCQVHTLFQWTSRCMCLTLHSIAAMNQNFFLHLLRQKKIEILFKTADYFDRNQSQDK